MEGTEATVSTEVSQGVSESAPAAPAPAVGESPAPAAPSAEQSVPYERFSGVNERMKAAEAQVADFQRQALATTPAPVPVVQHEAVNPTGQQAPVFDAETERSLNEWYTNQQASDPRNAEVENLRKIANEASSQMKIFQYRQSVEGFGDNEDEVIALYGKLHKGGFAGEDMVRILTDAVRAKSGSFHAAGREEAQAAQTMRAQTTGPPSGAAPGATEQPKALGDMTLEERAALYKGNLRNAALRPD